MATAVDPICNMDVDTDNPPGGQSEQQGTTYYFCVPGCRVAFEKEPEKYLADDWKGIDMESQHAGHDDSGHDHGGHDHGERQHEEHQHGEPEKKGSFFSRLFGRG